MKRQKKPGFLVSVQFFRDWLPLQTDSKQAVFAKYRYLVRWLLLGRDGYLLIHVPAQLLCTGFHFDRTHLGPSLEGQYLATGRRSLIYLSLRHWQQGKMKVLWVISALFSIGHSVLRENLYDFNHASSGQVQREDGSSTAKFSLASETIVFYDNFYDEVTVSHIVNFRVAIGYCLLFYITLM